MVKTSSSAHLAPSRLRRLILLLSLGVALQIAPISSFAQYTKLFDFGTRASGSGPTATPISDGTFLYGTATTGGGHGSGVIYKVKPDGSAFTTLYEFDDATGTGPIGDLLYDGTFLYGMTRTGGANGQGAIYKIKPDGTGFTLLFSFLYIPTGGYPFGSLITDGTSLYGMTSQGGSGFYGTVFKINKDGSGYTKLVEFTGLPDGSGPEGSLLLEGGFLYGMTISGGTSDAGTIFKVKTDGSGYLKIFDFIGASTGINPYGSLVSDGSFLYGMTSRGGTNNSGAIFKIKNDGTGFIKMLDFSNTITGGFPKGSLSFDGTFLYGTTAQGGANSFGTIFKIKPDGTGFLKLLDMTGDTGGPFPEGTLLISGTVMYGVRSAAGGGRYGAIFKLNNDGSAFTTLFTFIIEAHGPVGRPITDGTAYYGLATSGGLNDDGAIYKINPDGSGYTRIFDFEAATTGEIPGGSLIFDGTFFYGMTFGGGANGEGTIFKIRPNGTGYLKLMDFDDPTTGSFPNGSLISDGTFLYGMTSQGGTLGDGVIFKIQLNGTNFTNLLNLDYLTSGVNPYGTLIFDGTFLYGLTSVGGVNGNGVAFKIKTDGSGFVSLHEFDYPQGSTPRASLTAVGTTLYGLTSSGGTSGEGTLFKVNKDGTGFNVLLYFDSKKTGSLPMGSLIHISGYLYGMAASGGQLFKGTLFRIKTDGTGFQKYLDFDDGSQPIGSLATDGTFLYGTTSTGGAFDVGTFFKTTVTPFVKVTTFEQTHGVPGQYITVRGHGFDPVPANNVVAFGGEPAVVISGTADSLVVAVPEGASDGPISVTAGGLSDTTTENFIVDSEATMVNGKIRTCNVTFVEPEGSNTDDRVETFIPDTPSGKLRVSFSVFGVEDVLNIYDGPDINSPLLAATTDIQTGDQFVATSAGGELTFEYIWQDASSNWKADITCDGVNSISINTEPVATAVCNGKTATFTVAASGTTNLTYHWQYSPNGVAAFTDIANGSGYSNATTATLTVNTAGNFGGGFYRCRVNGDIASEQKTDEVALTVNPGPAAPVASSTPVGCAPSSVDLSVTGGTNGQYSWYTLASGGTAIAGQSNGTFTTPVLTTTTTYYATVTVSSCESARTAVLAEVETCTPSATGLVIYNAVSPNGDHKNDFFMIEFVDVIPGKQKNKVNIFNRWGDEVFSVSDYNNSDRVFAGINNKGNKLPSGIYFYSIAFSDGSETLTGYLELKN